MDFSDGWLCGSCYLREPHKQLCSLLAVYTVEVDAVQFHDVRIINLSNLIIVIKRQAIAPVSQPMQISVSPRIESRDGD